MKFRSFSPLTYCIVLTLVSGFAIYACGSTKSVLTTEELYSPEVTEVLFEVDYQEGAEPFVGEIQEGVSTWNFLRNNVSAMFRGTKTITVPVTLEEMEEIPGQSTNYSSDDIFDLVDQYRTTSPLSEGRASIYVLFLDGLFLQDNRSQNSVLGVSFADQGVIAIFKRAILINTFPSQVVRNFVEQVTLIHEAGHSIGLVNNGLKQTSDHHDIKHGAHCTNDQCVMYWLNEGVLDLVDFVRNNDPNAETIIYGDECIRDGVAAVPEE